MYKYSHLVPREAGLTGQCLRPDGAELHTGSARGHTSHGYQRRRLITVNMFCGRDEKNDEIIEEMMIKATREKKNKAINNIIADERIARRTVKPINNVYSCGWGPIGDSS